MADQKATFDDHFSGDARLSLGDSGPALSPTQRYLTRFGFAPEPITEPTLSDATSHALRLLQRSNQLDPSGVLDQPTIQVLQRPRCGVSDVSSLVHLFGAPADLSVVDLVVDASCLGREDCKWEDELSFGYYFTGSWSASYRVAVGIAFESWQTRTGDLVQFVEGLGGAVNIELRWLDFGDEDDGKVVADALYPCEGGNLIRFNDRRDWAAGGGGGAYDPGFVAVHEIGHVLGLRHNDYCSLPQSRMSSVLEPDNDDRHPLRDDIDAVKQLYS